MKLVNECFDKVKRDYLKFLKKEKIYKKSMFAHTKNLKNIYIPIAFWINKNNIARCGKATIRLYFESKTESKLNQNMNI